MTARNEFNIGQLAREFGITTRTIRHYEDLGLLHPRRRGQTRVYSPADRTRLKLILRGKRLGFSLEESRAIVDLYDPAQGNVAQLSTLLERLHQQREKLLRQRDDIDHMLASLEETEAGCRKALKQARKQTEQSGAT